MVRALGVSIIVDSYNHERFVEATIRSALAQTHAPLQVIVVDDGSPDSSQDIIKSFGKAVQSIFQDNQGQVAACRNALKHAEHDIVMFLDSDDLLEPHAASTVAETWSDGVCKVQFCLQVIDEHGTGTGNVFPKYSPDLTPERVRREMMRAGSYPDSPTSGNAYDRRFLEKTMPLLPRRNGIDGELNGIAPLYGDVLSLNQPLGSYRVHGDNDFAQQKLEIDKFTDYLCHSEARLRFIREHYQSMGQEIDADVLDHDLKYQEYALVVEKLGKIAGDRQRHLLKTALTGIIACWQAPHELVQRLYRALWMAAVTAAPKRLAAALVEQRFIPGRRSGLITRLVNRDQEAKPEDDGRADMGQGLKPPRPSSSHV